VALNLLQARFEGKKKILAPPGRISSAIQFQIPGKGKKKKKTILHEQNALIGLTLF